MEKDDQVRASNAIGRVAAVAALAAVVVLVVLLFTGGKEPYKITASFENASQLVNGNVVTIGGARVGLVEKIELGNAGEALVTFTVDDEQAPLQEGTIAQVRSFSLSGVANRQIELRLPGEGQGGDEIPSGGTLSQLDTVSEVDLDEIFNTLDDETVADFKKVIKGFSIAQSGSAAEDLNEGFRYLNPFLSTSRQTFAELTRDERALENLIVDGSQLTGTLAAREGDISALIGNLDQMMGAIASRSGALREGISGLPDFLRNFNTTAVNLRATLDDVDPLVDASKPVALELRPFFREFRVAARNLVPTTRDLDVIISHPGRDNDLVDLTRLQPRLTKIASGPVNRNGQRRQGTFPESTTALSDSLDELAFFRAYQPELTGWFDDFGHSGVLDANGGIGRIGTTFNTFTVGANDLPVVDLGGLLKQTPAEQADLLDIGNLQRCPGSNERPAPDGSNPFTDGGTIKCDPSIVPPGS